jgi:hypothetical protein
MDSVEIQKETFQSERRPETVNRLGSRRSRACRDALNAFRAFRIRNSDQPAAGCLDQFVCFQQRRGDDEAPNAKATLLNLDSAFSDHQELGERVVGLPVDRARLRRSEPCENIIISSETHCTAKVGRTV